MSQSAVSLTSSSSSFVTSSEDDHALSEDLSSDTSDPDIGNRRMRKIRDEPDSLHRGLPNRKNRTRDDEPQYKTVSERFYKKRNGREEFWDWRRPCLKDFKGFAIGDSMLRCFNQIGYRYDGFRISAFGGCELLDLISLLRMGKIVRKLDTRNKETRDKVLSRELELPLRLDCPVCNSNCTGKCSNFSKNLFSHMRNEFREKTVNRFLNINSRF